MKQKINPTVTVGTIGDANPAVGLSSSNALLVSDFDYETDSTPPEKGGTTLCGELGRKHRMKRYGPMHTGCVYPGCDACQ